MYKITIRKMKHCRTSKIDDVIDIVRNESCDFNPEPDTLPRVSEICPS